MLCESVRFARSSNTNKFALQSRSFRSPIFRIRDVPHLQVIWSLITLGFARSRCYVPGCCPAPLGGSGPSSSRSAVFFGVFNPPSARNLLSCRSFITNLPKVSVSLTFLLALPSLVGPSRLSPPFALFYPPLAGFVPIARYSPSLSFVYFFVDLDSAHTSFLFTVHDRVSVAASFFCDYSVI